MYWLLVITLINGEPMFVGRFATKEACESRQTIVFGERQCVAMVPMIKIPSR